jgi:hypothetical protein
MPWSEEQVPAELFLSHNGVHIYCTYDQNEMSDGASENYFANYPYADQSTESFDVRELSTWVEPDHPGYRGFENPENQTPENEAAWKRYHEDKVYEKAVKAAIIAAIDKGEIKAHPDYPDAETEDDDKEPPDLQSLYEYIEYVNEKVSRSEMPLTFDQWEESND